MRRTVVPIIFVTLFGVVIGVLYALRGDPETGPRDGSSASDESSEIPAFVREEDRDRVADLRRRIRDRLGVDAGALHELAQIAPDDPADRVEWLLFVRPELDLAIRSGDANAGFSAVAGITLALGEPGSPARTLVGSPAFRDTWIRALESETPELRAGALKLLEVLGGDANRSRVVPLLEDPVRDVRVTAVDTYARMGGTTARLVARHAVETDGRVRLSILMAFGDGPDHRSPDVFRIEAEALRGGTDAERIQAMRNLAKFRDQDLLDSVLDNLESPSALVRQSALETVARLRDRRALERLRAHVETENDEALVTLAKKTLADLE